MGLAVRRACYGVLRFIMESGALGCEVIVSGKLRAQRAKAMKFCDGYMIKQVTHAASSSTGPSATFSCARVCLGSGEHHAPVGPHWQDGPEEADARQGRC